MQARFVLALLLAPAVAHADDDEDRQMFISIGGTFAYAFHDTLDNGGVLGAEVSLGTLWFADDDDDDDGSDRFRLNIDPYWAGGYFDFVHDFGSDTSRISIGPEVGHMFFGIDGGLLVQLGEQQRTGITIRPVFTVAAAALYLRYGRYFDDDPDPTLWELGILLKVPKPF